MSFLINGLAKWYMTKLQSRLGKYGKFFLLLTKEKLKFQFHFSVVQSGRYLHVHLLQSNMCIQQL